MADDGDILTQTEQKIEASLVKQTRDNYDKIVLAGMHAGLAGGPNSILAKLRDSKDPIHDCAVGAVSMVLILRKQAKGVMPLKAMIPAATTLMIKALQFAEKAGMVEVSPAQLAQGTRILVNALFHAFGITPQMMQSAAQKVHGMTQDPGKMEAIRRASGVVKDPAASSPTIQ